MRFTLIASLILAALVAGCGSPIHSVHTQSAEVLTRAREQQLLAEDPNLAKLDHWERRDVLNEELEIPELRAYSREAEANTRIAALLTKNPAQMTAEEFQMYLLMEQISIAKQHAENHRSWQKFDVLFRVCPTYATRFRGGG